jgi:predicted exporter
VVAGTVVVVLAGLPLLPHIRFDFDPINLQDQHSEAVTTYRELAALPELGINAANAIVPSVDRLEAEARPLRQIPEVAGTRTVLDLVPAEQEAKLEQLGNNANGPAASAAARLVPLLDRLAAAEPAQRAAADDALALPLGRDLDRLRHMLSAEPVALKSLPTEVAREWVAPDGRARVEILPKADQNDSEAMRRFARAIVKYAPDAAGTPIQLYHSERTVIRAFVEAGVLAVLAIGVILFVALRRVGDVLLTLVPLLVAGLVTLELMVLLGLSLNFANVIALPLLLGVGVAFKIYYIMAWRTGRTNLLQSTLTRAVFFSALTTATAFGSLWLSPQPGLSSMGELMTLALACTMAAAVLFQPALMGPPRRAAPLVPSIPQPAAAYAPPEPAREKEPARAE